MRRPSSGPVRALVLAGISTISKPFGLIWTRTASRRERPRCSNGPFRRIGAKECGLRVGMVTAAPPQPPTVSGNGHSHAGDSKDGASEGNGDDLDARIVGMEKTVGTVLYRNMLREYGRVNQPKLIHDPAVKRTILQMLESAARGIARLDSVTKRLDAKTVEALLAKLQAPPLGEISDMKTLQHVVFGLEELAGSDQHNAA